MVQANQTNGNIGPFTPSRTVLGSGATGQVVLAKQPDGTPCALKVLKTTNPRWQMLHKNILQEIEALQKLDHPNIMKLIGSGIGAEWIENGETVQGD